MSDVVQKLWGFCHTLRHDGIGYTEYVEQLTYLLFLKMAHERGLELPRKCDSSPSLAKTGHSQRGTPVSISKGAIAKSDSMAQILLRSALSIALAAGILAGQQQLRRHGSHLAAAAGAFRGIHR